MRFSYTLNLDERKKQIKTAENVEMPGVVSKQNGKCRSLNPGYLLYETNVCISFKNKAENY
jgi:hypothetical protein